MSENCCRRSVISHTLTSLLNTLGSTNTDGLENPAKENCHLYLAECLTSAFQQIRSNLDLENSALQSNPNSTVNHDEQSSHVHVLNRLTEISSANLASRAQSSSDARTVNAIAEHEDPLTAEHRKRFHQQLSRCSSLRIPTSARRLISSQSMPNFADSPGSTLPDTLDSYIDAGFPLMNSSPEEDNPLSDSNSLESSYNDLLTDSESERFSPHRVSFMPSKFSIIIVHVQ
jgi:hypothetical protein